VLEDHINFLDTNKKYEYNDFSIKGKNIKAFLLKYETTAATTYSTDQNK
jgi:hypothetical protein